MSAIPILKDLNLNYSEILKGRLENVVSLPTGLNINHRGYAVYYANKIWVWNGSRWMTWDGLPWSHENNTLDSNRPRNETTPFSITSYYLNDNGSNILNINISDGYDDNVARCIGTLHFIGTIWTIDDWNNVKGRRLIYTARDGSWFNIKNLSEEPIPINHKRVDTGTGADLTGLIKAEFSYSVVADAWILVSFENKVFPTTQESLNPPQCCKQEIYYELISVSENVKLELGSVPNDLFVTINQCTYLEVHIQGEWSAEAADNNRGIDFHNTPLYCQFLVRRNEQSKWKIFRSVRYDWQSGETIYFDEKFICSGTGDFFVGCSFSNEMFGHGDVVYPIQNYDKFWIKMTILKCPKTSWFKRYDIPDTAITSSNEFVGYIPNLIDEGLPFDGFYEVMAFVEFREYEANKIDNASCVNPQTFELMPPLSDWKLIDKSGAISAGTHEDIKWFNFSLQGSIIIFVSLGEWDDCDSRKIAYRVTLPNGVFKQILGGYIHVKYLGLIEGMSCHETEDGNTN